MMRLSDLRDKLVRTLDGESLGRVHEIHCENGQVTALIVGPRSFLERLTATSKGRRIPWNCVKRVQANAIIVTPDPPQRGSGARKQSATALKDPVSTAKRKPRSS
jgi:sporulation protein YlmC with PRC-barrel domain